MDLGRTEDMTFTGKDHAIPSSDGEHLALESVAPLEPEPGISASIAGTHSVFSRTPTGWEMRSATVPGAGTDRLEMYLFSPDLSRVALVSYTALNEDDESEDALEVGALGGSYALLATVPNNGQTEFLGANAGTESIPAFSDVLFASKDHELLPVGPKRVVAEAAVNGVHDLYDWTGGELRLVNVTSNGTLLDPCGAVLGAGGNYPYTVGATNAVSDDGSRFFFTSPDPIAVGANAACNEPSRLYMRVDGRETVEVSEPEPGVKLGSSERQNVTYNVATPDGSEVFFTTRTPLTGGETVGEQSENKLFEYNTEAPEGQRLKLVGSGVRVLEGNGGSIVVSEDGSTVYYEKEGRGGVYDIYRYETEVGQTTFVATAREPIFGGEHLYTTRNGEFLLFPARGASAGGLAEEEGVSEPSEPRGARHSEIYRYDKLNDSVMCVSCGEGDAPLNGNTTMPHIDTPLETTDEIPDLIPMSEDGQEVFFQTSAQLVPQDTNISTTKEEKENFDQDTFGQDVYEWEADGAGGCELSQGCTYLLSSGEHVGPAIFLGASRDGSNVFFTTAAQLVPQATPEFTNIYDARVDGGFPPPPPPSECLSCQGVGSTPPLFSVPAGVSFTGAGNPAMTVFESGPKTKTKTKTKKPKTRHRKRHRGRSSAVSSGTARTNKNKNKRERRS